LKRQLQHITCEYTEYGEKSKILNRKWLARRVGRR